ncbi:MAG TPA: ATP-binding protein [Thermoanaerobaculia bacterium]|nr:ATP-binding protein [Thermoanaerobaculia bacterium]
MTRARILRLTFSLLLAAAVVSLGGLSFHRKVLGFQPLGFEAHFESGDRSGAAQVQWVGDRGTGLREGDQILLVGASEVPGAAQLAELLKQGPESRLTLLRGGELLQVTYRRPALQLEIAYLLLALIGVGYLLIGHFTLLRQPGRPGMLFFLWCLASAALYLLSPEMAPLAVTQDLLFKLCFAGDQLARLLLPALTLHLFLVFPEPLKGALVHRGRAFLYLPAAVLLLLQANAMGLLQRLTGQSLLGPWTAQTLQRLDRLELLHLALYALAAVAVLAVRLARGRVWEQQRQLLWVTFGLAGGYLPFLLFYGLPAVLGLRWPEPAAALAVLPLALVPIAFAYAILRYKLWDIEVIVRDVASSTLTLLLGIIGFSLVNLAIVRGVPQDLSVARNLLSFASGLGIAGLLLPTRRTIASSLERLQYRGTFGKRRALSGLGRQLLHERDLGQLSAALVERIAEGVALERSNLYLAQGGNLAVLRPEPELPTRLAQDAFTGDTDEGEGFWQCDVRRLPGTGLPGEPPSPAQRLFIAGYRYAFPLTVLGNRVGVVLTGHKQEGAPLNSDDIALIRHLLDQAALAIENAQLLGQLNQRLEEVVHLQRYSEGILESSPAGIAVIDVVGERVVSANAAFAQLAEVDRESLAGRPLAELLPVSPLPAPGEPPLEISFCDGQGRERHLQLSLAAYTGALPGEYVDRGAPGSDGSPDAPGSDGSPGSPGSNGSLRILVVHDVSERVAMETALKEKDRLAALGLLAAGVAHEVNTPITGISSYAQMLLEDTPEGDPHREILQKMERQTFRASRIVNNLLGYARNRSTDRRPVALAPLLAETVDLLSDRLRKRRVEVAWQLPEGTSLSVAPDRPAADRPAADRPATDRAAVTAADADCCVVLACDGELQQVFTNLLLNAVDAMGEGGGRLTLGLEADGELVRVRVEDTGPGIPPERLDRIFKPFFSTKLSSGGTGLGLAISYDIVRRHGGTIAVASEPGAGACFTVELPRLDRQQVSA